MVDSSSTTTNRFVLMQAHGTPGHLGMSRTQDIERGVFGLSLSLTHTVSREAGTNVLLSGRIWQRTNFCFMAPGPSAN